MTHSPKEKKLSSQEIESMEIAVEQSDIRAIHPDKMEAFAASNGAAVGSGRSQSVARRHSCCLSCRLQLLLFHEEPAANQIAP